MATRRSSRKPTSSRRKAPASKPVPGWVWIFGITAFLAFAGFLYYLTQVPASTPAPVAQPKVTPKPAPSQPAAKKPETKKTEPKAKPEEPRFQFYEMLPETEVVAPQVDAYQTGNKDRDQYHYLLQVGSFRSAQDAERQRALVAFQGMKGTIDAVTSSDGTQWHRVHVGPFTSRSAMNKAVDKLVTLNIQPLVKKIKQEPKAQGQR